MNDEIMNQSTANQQQSQSNWGDWLTQLGGVAAQVGYNIYANKQNQKFNAQQAELQRQYETQMANTAYQRQQADLKAAGLNPHLAGGQGGADTTAGAAATSSGMQAADMGGLGAFGLQTALTHAQLSNLEADTSMKNKQSGKTQKETEYVENKMGLETALNEVQIELTQAQTKDAKKAAEQKQQILIHQMIENYYEFITGRKMPTSAIDAVYGRIDYLLRHVGKSGANSQSADALYQIIKAEIDKYNKGNNK